MSAAPAGVLPILRDRMRHDVGREAIDAGAAWDATVDAVCRRTNVEHWTKLARRQPASQAEAVSDAKLLIAAVGEDLEARWTDQPAVREAHKRLGSAAVGAFLRLWFASADNRAFIRQAVREARKT